MFRLTLILSLFVTTLTFSQELACTVTVDARQTGNENLQIFRSLQTQLTDFINITQSLVDITGFGNHFRIIFQK